MKKILALVLSVIMVLGLFCACGAKEESLTIEEGKLIMSTNAAFPPYEFIEGNQIAKANTTASVDMAITASWIRINAMVRSFISSAG